MLTSIKTVSPLVSLQPGSCDVSFWTCPAASLQRTTASGERGIVLFPSSFGCLPGPFQLFPVTHGQAADVGWGGLGVRSAGSWRPVRHLHVNVFKAISGLAIIPTASG